MEKNIMVIDDEISDSSPLWKYFKELGGDLDMRLSSVRSQKMFTIK